MLSLLCVFQDPIIGNDIIELMENVSLNKPDTAFKFDACGNKIIPGSVFGSAVNVRATTTTSKKVVIDVVGAIMAIEGKNRNDSCEVWRELDEAARASILADLEGNECGWLYM